MGVLFFSKNPWMGVGITVTLLHQLEGLDKKHGIRYSPLADKGSDFIPNLFRHSEGDADPGPVAYGFATATGAASAPAPFLFLPVFHCLLAFRDFLHQSNRAARRTQSIDETFCY